MKLVVKVGTSTVTHATGAPNMRLLIKLARVLCDIAACGHHVVLVTSGAIGVGVSKLKLPARPTALREKQAAAAIGQCALMHVYDSVFSDYNHTVAQMLLSRSDLERPTARAHLLDTFSTLFDMNAIAIVNENDSVHAEEIEGADKIFGDNDRLSAEVAALLNADLLVLLSDIDAVYDADPRHNANARPIAIVHEITEDLRNGAVGPGSARGTGGMKTKLMAGEICLANGIDMIVTRGDEPEVLYDILDGKPVGTLFTTKK